MIGETFSGTYTIVEKIGAGGMAEVYKAYDNSFDRYVAVKVLPELYMGDLEFRERFEREAKAIATLEHIHILPVHAYGEKDGVAFLVMRYIDTGTLAGDISDRLLPMPLDEASRLLNQMADALDYAHQRGIIHRDMKPSNVLLDADRNAYLADFGLAKIVAGSSNLTNQSAIGTPNYMSPEQCMGEEYLTPATDQYALGVVLYEMVTGQTPFFAHNPLKVFQMHINDPVPSPRALRSELPEMAEVVLLQALTKQPEHRFPTCSAFAKAFEQGLAGKGLHRLSAGRLPSELRSRIDSALAQVQLDDTEEESPPDDEDDYYYDPDNSTLRAEPPDTYPDEGW